MKYTNTFFIGIISALAALVLEYVFLILFFPATDAGISQKFSGLATAVFLEEIIKFSVLLKISENKNSKFIFLSSIYFGISFSLAEIIININGSGASVQNFTAFVYIALTHLATCSLFGYILAYHRKTVAYSSTLFFAIILHLSLNFFLLRQYIGYREAAMLLFLIFSAVCIKFLFFAPKNLSLPKQEL